MSPVSTSRLDIMGRFFANASLARSVVFLLAGAIALLLIVNVSTFVLIQRTAEFNERVDATWQIRRATRNVLLNVQDGERAQRGFLLTGQAKFLADYQDAERERAGLLADLERRVAGDAQMAASAETARRILQDKYHEMSSTLDAARQGRIGEAISAVRTGRGQALMTELREEIVAVDRLQGERVDDLRRMSVQSAFVTIAVNAAAGVLIVVLAGIVAILVRRYLADMTQARMDIDRVNAGLEETVRNRTAALTRANEEVQRFAYIVSHDLRAPLVNIMGYTSELEQAGVIIDRQVSRLETLAPDLVESDAVAAVREDVPEAVGFIRASTEKMDRLINAILKLSREGRRNLLAETLDMTALMTAIADSVNHQTEAADAEIVVEDLPSFESDRLSIEQIMGNLIDNAVKYLDPTRRGRIVVSGADVAGGWVEYAIADNGRGISDRDHERIFELFRRSGRQDTRGEGLGLAFVRNSVRRLGGAITVESMLGEGSTFRVKFPKRLIVVEGEDAA